MGSMYDLVDWKGLISEALSTECQSLTIYLQRYTVLEHTILSHTSSLHLSPWEQSLLISYLDLHTLNHDNAHTGSIVAWAHSPLRTQLDALATQLSTLLTRTTTPTFIPLASTWLRRARQDHETLLSRQDALSLYKWTIAVLHHVREVLEYGHGAAAGPDPAALASLVYGIEQLMVAAKKALDGIPEITLVRYVVDLFRARAALSRGREALVEAYMVFEELLSELKAGGMARGDPYLGNKLNTLEMRFEEAFKGRFDVPAQRLFQEAAMKVYTEWRKAPMLYSRLAGGNQAVAVLVKTERALCRIEGALKRMGECEEEGMKALADTLLTDCDACLVTVRRSTSTVQYAQGEAEMGVPMLKEIARTFVKK